MFKSKLSKENSSLKSELLLTKKALSIYKNDQEELWDIDIKEGNDIGTIKVNSLKYNPNKWDVNYLGFNGEVVETSRFKSEREFEKEIRESNNIGRPIDYQSEKELER